MNKSNNATKIKINVTELDVSTPLDITMATEILGGEPSVYLMMLSQLEELSVIPTMQNIAKLDFDNMDHLKLKDYAHSLKGSSAYVGASRIHYACYFLQEHFINK